MKCIRKVVNPYNHRVYYSDCGKCPACLQRKAMKRAERIINNAHTDYTPLFFHLTYTNLCLPYVDPGDFDFSRPGDIGVYRDFSYRQVFNRHDRKYHQKCYYNEHLADYHYTNLKEDDLLNCNIVNNHKIGVLYYPDIQNFFKNLRSKIVRNEKFEKLSVGKSLRYFVTGELGPRTQRPHWHVLLWIPNETLKDLDLWKTAIVETWPFAARWFTRKRIEIARSAAQYVSEYVNKSAVISHLFDQKDFSPKWHYSKTFGYGNIMYSLPNILEKIRSGNIEWSFNRTSKNGKLSTITIPLPSYIGNYYFPKFKGICRLSDSDIERAIRQPDQLYKIFQQDIESRRTDYDEVSKLVNFLRSKRKLFYKECNLPSFTIDTYSDYYMKYYRLRRQYMFKRFYEDVETDIYTAYDNAFDFFSGVSPGVAVGYGFVDLSKLREPTFYEYNVRLDDMYRNIYAERIKKRADVSIAYNDY